MRLAGEARKVGHKEAESHLKESGLCHVVKEAFEKF